mgnify:CR=1 FL=1
MKHLAPLLIAAGLLAALPAQANVDLAKKNNCMTCHAVDKKMVGPSFADVSQKYKGDKSAAGALSAKVKSGSKGVWGQIPMPPQPTVKDADRDAIIKWILAGAK